jgi:hypothetical protein
MEVSMWGSTPGEAGSFHTTDAWEMGKVLCSKNATTTTLSLLRVHASLRAGRERDKEEWMCVEAMN